MEQVLLPKGLWNDQVCMSTNRGKCALMHCYWPEACLHTQFLPVICLPSCLPACLSVCLTWKTQTLCIWKICFLSTRQSIGISQRYLLFDFIKMWILLVQLVTRVLLIWQFSWFLYKSKEIFQMSDILTATVSWYDVSE